MDPASRAELTPDELRLLPGRDPAVLGRFFDVWFDRVHAFVRRLVADEHLAEDLTQDVFAHVYRALPSYDPARDLRPWLWTIAANKVRDHWRARGRRDAGRTGGDALDGAGGPEAEPAGDAELPEAALARSEIAGAVRRAIDELPEGMRTTLVLRAFEGLSFEEIGAIEGRNEVAIRKRYSRALEALRGRLEATYRLHAEGM